MRVDLFIWYFFFQSTTVLNCTGIKRFRVAAWLVYTDYPVSNTSIVIAMFVSGETFRGTQTLLLI